MAEQGNGHGQPPLFLFDSSGQGGVNQAFTAGLPLQIGGGGGGGGIGIDNGSGGGQQEYPGSFQGGGVGSQPMFLSDPHQQQLMMQQYQQQQFMQIQQQHQQQVQQQHQQQRTQAFQQVTGSFYRPDIYISCSQCASSKRRCDGMHPCERCGRLNKQCTYIRDAPAPPPPVQPQPQSHMNTRETQQKAIQSQPGALMSTSSSGLSGMMPHENNNIESLYSSNQSSNSSFQGMSSQQGSYPSNSAQHHSFAPTSAINEANAASSDPSSSSDNMHHHQQQQQLQQPSSSSSSFNPYLPMNFFSMPVPPGMPGGAQQTQMIFPQQDSVGGEEFAIVPSNLVQGVPLMQPHDDSGSSGGGGSSSSWNAPQQHSEELSSSSSLNHPQSGSAIPPPSFSVVLGLKQPLPEVLGLKTRSNLRRVGLGSTNASTKTSNILRGMINEGNLDDLEAPQQSTHPRISGSASALPMQLFPWRLVMPSHDTPVSIFSAQSNFEALLKALTTASESQSSSSSSSSSSPLIVTNRNKVYLAYLWASALGRLAKKDSKDVIGGGFQALFRDRGFTAAGSWVGIASFSSSAAALNESEASKQLPQEFVRESRLDLIPTQSSTASSATVAFPLSMLTNATQPSSISNPVHPPPPPQRANSRVVASITTVLHARVEHLMPVPSSLLFNENSSFQQQTMSGPSLDMPPTPSITRQFNQSAPSSSMPLQFQSLLSSVHFAAVSRVLSSQQPSWAVLYNRPSGGSFEPTDTEANEVAMGDVAIKAALIQTQDHQRRPKRYFSAGIALGLDTGLFSRSAAESFSQQKSAENECSALSVARIICNKEMLALLRTTQTEIDLRVALGSSAEAIARLKALKASPTPQQVHQPLLRPQPIPIENTDVRWLHPAFLLERSAKEAIVVSEVVAEANDVFEAEAAQSSDQGSQPKRKTYREVSVGFEKGVYVQRAARQPTQTESSYFSLSASQDESSSSMHTALQTPSSEWTKSPAAKFIDSIIANSLKSGMSLAGSLSSQDDSDVENEGKSSEASSSADTLSFPRVSVTDMRRRRSRHALASCIDDLDRFFARKARHFKRRTGGGIDPHFVFSEPTFDASSLSTAPPSSSSSSSSSSSPPSSSSSEGVKTLTGGYAPFIASEDVSMIFVDTPADLIPELNSRPNRMLLAASVSSFSDVSFPESDQNEPISSSSVSSSSSSSKHHFLNFETSRSLTRAIQSSCVEELIFNAPTSKADTPDSCDEDDARDDDLYETQLQQHRQVIDQQRLEQAALLQQQKRQALSQSSRAFTDTNWSNPTRGGLMSFDGGRSAHEQHRPMQSKQRQREQREHENEMKQHLIEQQQQLQFQQILHEQRQQILMQLQPQLTTVPPPELTLSSLEGDAAEKDAAEKE